MRTARAVVLVLAASGAARGETYYVSPPGGDGASGLDAGWAELLLCAVLSHVARGRGGR